MRVAELHLSDRNPRTISPARFENLKRSLREDPEFLDARPLLVNSYPGRENIAVAGNMRLRAAQELGWTEVPALVVSIPPEIEAQWNLKDNNQWGLAEIDRPPPGVRVYELRRSTTEPGRLRGSLADESLIDCSTGSVG
jgi:ParB-like chromosome segregation protein Spo0J